MAVDRITESDDPEVQEILALDLPDFVTLPEFKPIVVMMAIEKDGKLEVGFEDSPSLTWPTAHEAYDSLEYQEVDVLFDDSLEAFGELIGGLLFDRDGNRILISSTDEDALFLLKGSYKEFLEFDEKYQADPSNWSVAYHWLDHHPAFWKHSEKTDHYLGWSTQYGVEDIWKMVTEDEDSGEPLVLLETGAHVLPKCETRYLDEDLDVQAPTFEEAYVKLAAKVAKYFNPDGSEKEGVRESTNTRRVGSDSAHEEQSGSE